MLSSDPSLVPRDGATLRVLAVTRISTMNQQLQSLTDQEAMARKWVAARYDGRIEFKFVSTRGSGEWLDRGELLEIEQEVASARYDLVFMEDLGRYLRDLQAVRFCGLCVDFGTRLIAQNDNIDTGREGWNDGAFIAAWRHSRYNEDTSRRIKQRLANRFVSEGGIVQVLPYGYVRPPRCHCDKEVVKDPTATATYDHWFTLLESGASFAEVADWLNERQIPVGPHCRNDKWDARMVGRVTRNPILKGVRQRNMRHTAKVNHTGHRRSVKAPPEMLKQRNCPHLAHIAPDRFDRVLAMVNSRNRRYRRKQVNGRDPLQDRPRKRTNWPGQHCYCGICRRLFVYGAHGQRHHLCCRGAKDYQCWNSVPISGPLAAKKLATAIIARVEMLPEFDAMMLTKIRQQILSAGHERQARAAEVRQKLDRLAREKDNLVTALRRGGLDDVLHDEIRKVCEEQRGLELKAADLARLRDQTVNMPSIEQIKAAVRQAIAQFPTSAPEFGRAMKALIPRIVLRPYRSCDGGKIVTRAFFTLNLGSLIPNAGDLQGLQQVLAHELCVDLFDAPQRVQHRPAVMALVAAGMTWRDIAIELKITQEAVRRTVALDRRMRELGLDDPYVPVLEPPADYGRLRRHKRDRYHLQPLPDYE